MDVVEGFNTAVRLPGGDVLVIGAEGPSEIYRVASGTFEPGPSFAGIAPVRRVFTLSDGIVMVLGQGRVLYNFSTGTGASSTSPHYLKPSVALLRNEQLLATGGWENYECKEWCSEYTIDRAFLSTYVPDNLITGYLTLPVGWINTITVTARFSGTATTAPLLEAEITGGPNPIPATNGELVTTALTLYQQGTNRQVRLRLRDAWGRSETVVTGTVAIDRAAPSSSMTALPAQSQPSFTLRWQSSDNLSGVAAYDVQARAGSSGAWADLLTNTQATTTTFSGTSGTTYYFRVRARDHAGNVEAFRQSYNTSTLADSTAPGGAVTINDEAIATTSRAVSLKLSASDTVGTVASMRLRNQGGSWRAWTAYSSAVSLTLPVGDGLKTIEAQFRDHAGNLSAITSDTIRLDQAAGTERTITINNGAVSTQSTLVTLTIGAPAGTTQMQLSNDGGFGGAVWQPFDTRPRWHIAASDGDVSVYVRTRDAAGNISVSYSDNIRYEPQATQHWLYLPLVLRR
jgi:hypothetical protein